MLEQLQSGVLSSHKGPIVLKIVISSTTNWEKITLLEILICCCGNKSITGAKAKAKQGQFW